MVGCATLHSMLPENVRLLFTILTANVSGNVGVRSHEHKRARILELS